MTHTQSEDTMTGEWKTVKLGEITSFIAKGIPPKYVEAETDETIRVLNQKCNRNFTISYMESRLHDNAAKKVADEKMLRNGDVLINSTGTGTAGRVAQIWDIPMPTTIDGHMILIRPTEAVDTLYFGYAIKTFQKTIEGFAEGSTGQTEINRSRLLKEIELSLPPLDVQRRIAAVLKPLDDKIELNARINARLERVAQALFKRQFVRFEREKRPFSSLIQICGGGTPKTDVKEYWNGDIPFFTPKDANNTFTFKTEKSVTQLGIEQCNSPLYPANTTFITARGTVGKVSMAGIPMAMNQSCYALTSDVLDPILVYFYAQEIVKSLRKKASGAVFDAIVTRDFSSETISMLGDTEANEVLSAIKPLMNAIHLNLRQSRTLARLRDVLLPRLMSGAVDVGQVDFNSIQKGGSR